MNTKGPIIIFFLCDFLCSFSGCSSKQTTLSNIDLQKVDSLIKVQKVNDRTVIVNFGYDAITAIKTEQGIVLVDAGISTALTAKYREPIENIFRQDDYEYVINTHGHHDHIGGNRVFSQAKVVGHENCQNEVSERWTNPEKSMMSLCKIVEDYEQKLQQPISKTSEWEDIFTQKIRYMSAYFDVKNHIPVKLPDITFSDSMKLDLGDTTFEMIYFGKFHSNSDIVIYVPEIRLIFIGDLFSKYGRPSISNASTLDEVKCMRAISWIENRMHNIEKVIEGHGQILSIDDLKDFTNNILNMYPGQ
jgi:glyoxylase-like metal-dependent hydrolase (beta-lactamase superfamily II)